MDTVRLFVAVPLPESVLEQLADVRYRLQGKVPPGTVRWVSSDGIHLTLKFLGDTPRDKIPTVKEALSVVGRNALPCTLVAQGLGCFPNLRRPRVLWVGVTEPTGRLELLQKAIEEAMTSLGYKPERHSFTPHLTLGRVRRASGRDQRQIADAVRDTTVGELAEFSADGFELIRSDLKPGGAEYTTLETFFLLGDRT